MASRLDDLLNSVVNRLQSVGVRKNTKTARTKFLMVLDPYEGSQNLATEKT